MDYGLCYGFFGTIKALMKVKRDDKKVKKHDKVKKLKKLFLNAANYFPYTNLSL